MSISPHFRAMDVLVFTAILISGACHRAQPATPQPTVAERHFAGVDLVPTGHGGFVIRIHSGMVGNGEPLYVIDGAPLRLPPNRSIDWFKPEDIVDIRVLKHPHELAEYGPTGVNGVIVITTKQGAERSPRR
jgi:TonB-dependent starch-binding outer membrane protein SusC